MRLEAEVRVVPSENVILSVVIRPTLKASEDKVPVTDRSLKDAEFEVISLKDAEVATRLVKAPSAPLTEPVVVMLLKLASPETVSEASVVEPATLKLSKAASPPATLPVAVRFPRLVFPVTVNPPLPTVRFSVLVALLYVMYCSVVVE